MTKILLVLIGVVGVLGAQWLLRRVKRPISILDIFFVVVILGMIVDKATFWRRWGKKKDA